MQRHPMTPAGHEKLIEDLRYLKEVARPKIVRDIEDARAHGDISENSEYEDAKERQAHCEGRILELTGRIAAAEIIDIKKVAPSERVIFGTTVVVEDEQSEEQARYRIVGEDEADVKQGLLSVTSPIARALIGKNLGDEVSVETPKGARRFTITDVLYE
jgi:transcription elongation factor GreA